MFLVEKQKTRFDNYANLPPREKSTFTFRILEKIRTLLDDVVEANQVLEKLPHNPERKLSGTSTFTPSSICWKRLSSGLG